MLSKELEKLSKKRSKILSQISLSKQIRRLITKEIDKINGEIAVSFYNLRPDNNYEGIVGYVGYMDVVKDEDGLDRVKSFTRFIYFDYLTKELELSYANESGIGIENLNLDTEIFTKLRINFKNLSELNPEQGQDIPEELKKELGLIKEENKE